MAGDGWRWPEMEALAALRPLLWPRSSTENDSSETPELNAYAVCTCQLSIRRADLGLQARKQNETSNLGISRLRRLKQIELSGHALRIATTK